MKILIDRSAEAFRQHHYLLPLTHIEIEHDFQIGDVWVRTIQSTLFEQAANEARARYPDDPTAGADREELCREFANSVGVDVSVAGEPRYADEHALILADEIAGVMRFLSPGAISSTVVV